MPTKDIKHRPGEAAVHKSDHDADDGPVDEATLADMRLLYADSSRAVIFAKAQQWRTVGATLLLFLSLVLVTALVSKDPTFVNRLEALVIITGCAAAFIIVIYQFWQHVEHTKMAAIADKMSPAFRSVRRVKSKVEADFHRYTLLVFMIGIVVLGATVAYMALAEIVRH